jgi:hypothetical protein
VIFTRRFGDDGREVLRALEAGGAFALARFNTGEYPMVRGEPAAGKGSGWKASPKKNPTFYAAMAAAWACESPGWHVGISCPCCNPLEFSWYNKNLHVPVERVTFATVFMGSNWPTMRRWLLDHRGKYILVGPRGGGTVTPDFDVPANTFEPDWDWTQLRENLRQTMNGMPVLFACGPLGKVLCHELLPVARGPLVDIGSALDMELWGKPTRAYLRKPLRRYLKKKSLRKENNVRKRLWMRTCKWKLADGPVHRV